MRVLRLGSLVVEPGHILLMDDWVFDASDGVLPEDPQAQAVARLRAALLFLLELTGGTPPGVSDPVPTLESERAALDVIAAARWKPTGENDV